MENGNQSSASSFESVRTPWSSLLDLCRASPLSSPVWISALGCFSHCCSKWTLFRESRSLIFELKINYSIEKRKLGPERDRMRSQIAVRPLWMREDTRRENSGRGNLVERRTALTWNEHVAARCKISDCEIYERCEFRIAAVRTIMFDLWVECVYARITFTPVLTLERIKKAMRYREFQTHTRIIISKWKINRENRAESLTSRKKNVCSVDRRSILPPQYRSDNVTKLRIRRLPIRLQWQSIANLNLRIMIYDISLRRTGEAKAERADIIWSKAGLPCDGSFIVERILSMMMIRVQTSTSKGIKMFAQRE